MEDGRQVNRASLVDKVCFLSRWFNIWIIPLFNTGWKRTVVMQDVYGCAPSDDPHHLGSRLER